jgi:phospholipase C
MMKRFETLFFSAALVLIAGCSSSVGSTPAPGPSVSQGPGGSPIQHIVILVQENRSFNTMFAGFPGADTAMQGACRKGPACNASRTIPLHSVKLESGGTPNTGTDIDHSHHAFVVECGKNASGVCQNDGFNLIRYGQSGQGAPARKYPYAFVDRSETKPYWDLAKQYALSDETFFNETASSFIAHQILIAGSVALNNHESLTDQPNTQPWGCDAPPGTTTPVLFKNGRYSPNGPFPCFTYPTMADLLDAQKVSWLFYVDKAFGKGSDFSGCCWSSYRVIKKIFRGPDWKTNISSPNTNIFSDVKSGTLPAVSWVIPTLYDSDHPASGCNGGPWWITKVVNAIGSSQYWQNTAVILLWDDWGGWYDNVPPAQTSYTSLGFRVPMIVISAWSKPHLVSHTQYNFGSILKLVEQTFNLGSLGTSDKSSNSMDDVFDFTQSPNTFSPAPLPHAMACKNQVTNPGGMDEVIEHDHGVPE